MTPEEIGRAVTLARKDLPRRMLVSKARAAAREAARAKVRAERWARIERAFAAPFSMEKWRRA